MIAARRFACAAPAVRAQRSNAAISLTKLPKIVVSRPICDAMLSFVRGQIGRTGDPSRCATFAGPVHLSTIGTYMTPASILESLLEPSNKIKQGYDTVVIVRNNGTIVSGTLQRRSDTATLLRDTTGKIIWA